MAQICVVIPAYNAEAFLQQSIESVLTQTYTNWQLVIVDDGSKDQTYALAQTYAQRDQRIQAMTHANAGVSATRNHGASYAANDTRFILFLDADDYLHPHALQTLIQLLEQNLSAVAAYGLAHYVNFEGETIVHDISQAFGFVRRRVDGRQMRPTSDTEPTTFAELVIWPVIATPGQLLVRFPLYQQLNGYDTSSNVSEDWDFWLRLAALGDIQFTRQYVMSKREHVGGVSKDNKKMARAELWLRNKLATSPHYTVEQRQLARRGHLFSCLIKLTWAADLVRSGDLAGGLRALLRVGRSFVRFIQTPYQF
jgi:glycosyltransferase involved in cell wall biosynthesis